MSARLRGLVCAVLLSSAGCAADSTSRAPPPEMPSTVSETDLGSQGGSSAETKEGRSAGALPAPESARADASPRTDGHISRKALSKVLDAGLGRFLQGVVTEPYVEQGEFVGFRIERLWPDDERFAGVDLKPGDVVLRINGQPIERPAQLHSVWKSLRVASELVVEYLRDGERRELRYRIVD